MYGIKEKVIGKMLVKIMKINKESEDASNLLNWKLPGVSAARMAGDFAGRCYDVISKRPMRTEPGDMSIEEVNKKLDDLSAASKEDQQIHILAEFYRHMNPDELTWLIRIILRQMKVGATERTLFNVWHPDAENLYSISSSLRRVCWELHDPNIRLEAEDRGIGLMQCFQPQLAQFQMHSFERMISRMRPTEEDPVFWIEEKMDGERMQLHMAPDDSIPGGRRFRFWSRKAKEYTYLYGSGIYDEKGALTRHLENAFVDGVQSLILDGNMGSKARCPSSIRYIEDGRPGGTAQSLLRWTETTLSCLRHSLSQRDRPHQVHSSRPPQRLGEDSHPCPSPL
jgi:DNA ligase-4